MQMETNRELDENLKVFQVSLFNRKALYNDKIIRRQSALSKALLAEKLLNNQLFVIDYLFIEGKNANFLLHNAGRMSE